ncbi:hypothetical protein [Agrobacterium sp. P15N1-A]|uniref:hypothetical protein n=1 Tax=Agrobacterium sp. P15N1-A TaxID=3342820 RepID=UPI0037D08767
MEATIPFHLVMRPSRGMAGDLLFTLSLILEVRGIVSQLIVMSISPFSHFLECPV